MDKATLARNTATSALGYFVSLAIPILMIPYIVSRVSLAEYGFWVALNSLAAWISHYDVGLWGILAREVAERRARDDRDGLRVLWATWFFYDLAIGVLVVMGTVFLGRAIVRLAAPGLDPVLGSSVFALLAVQAALTPLLRHLMYSLGGLQRMDLVNRMAIVIGPLSGVGLVIFLEAGGGLPGMAANGAIFALIQAAILVMLLLREGYPASVSPALFSGAEFRRLLGVGWKLQAVHFLNQAFRSDRLLLGMTGFSPAIISVYQFGAGLMDRLAGSVSVLSSAVLPAAADLAARGDAGRVHNLLMRGTKYHALVAVGFLGFAALFGHELMLFWMGRALPEAVTVLRIMALGGIFTAIGSCAQSVGVALGRPGWALVATTVGLATTVFLYILVGRRYDHRGLAAVVSLGLALVQVVFMIGMSRVLEFRWREYVGNALLKPAVLVLPLSVVYVGWRLVAFPVETRLQALAVLAPAFLLALGLGWVTARALRVVDEYDVNVLRSAGRSVSA
jgi:O-antigen/teichoic acid export membrane protein